MVRPHQPYDEYHHGKLKTVRSVTAQIVEVYFIPPPIQLEQAQMDSREAAKDGVKILEVDNRNERITMFPINTFGDKPDFLQQKYEQVRKITLLNAQPVVRVRHDEAASDKKYTHSITFGPTTPIDV